MSVACRSAFSRRDGNTEVAKQTDLNTSKRREGGMVMNIKQLRGISIILELIVAALAGMLPRSASATPADYAFTPIATLGDPAPGPEGGEFTFDFEPYGINNRGEVAFVGDVTTGGEGVFLARKGPPSKIARPGDPAPGGGTFGFGGVWLYTGLHDAG